MSGYSPEEFSFSKKYIGMMPAGDYMVIDPCYVIGEDPFWSKFCSFCFPNGSEHVDPVWVSIGDQTFPIFSTAYGDGCYPVNDKVGLVGRAGVDAGCLCLIPLELVDDEDRDLGVSVTLTKPFCPKFPERGVAVFDYIGVDTKMDEEMEDYEI